MSCQTAAFLNHEFPWAALVDLLEAADQKMSPRELKATAFVSSCSCACSDYKLRMLNAMCQQPGDFRPTTDTDMARHGETDRVVQAAKLMVDMENLCSSMEPPPVKEPVLYLAVHGIYFLLFC